MSRYWVPLACGTALALSIFSFLWSILHDPLGRGMSAFDFTTPENAVRSNLSIEGNGDLRAEIQLSALLNRKIREKLGLVQTRVTIPATFREFVEGAAPSTGQAARADSPARPSKSGGVS